MLRPLPAFLHRSGLLSYLRAQWRADDASIKRSAKAHAAREAREGDARVHQELAALRALQAEQQVQRREQESALDARLRELAQDVRRLSAILAFNAEHREQRHAAALDSQRVAEHVAGAFAHARLLTDPAPHLVIDRVLPDDTYQALLDGIPPEPCFSQRDRTKQNFKPAPGRLAPDYVLDAWRFLERQVVAGALLPALVRCFQPYVDAVYRDKYGDRAAAIAALPLQATAGRLMLRRPGYHLDPHLDPSRVIVTCLLYFAHPGDNEQFGTQFFRIARTPTIDRTNTYFPEAHGYACELVRTVPFRPNTAVAFLNHNVAHGADIPATAPPETRRYAYQFYVSPDPDAASALLGAAAEEHD